MNSSLIAVAGFVAFVVGVGAWLIWFALEHESDYDNAMPDEVEDEA